MVDYEWRHENCGGEITLTTDENGDFWECDKCGELWDSPEMFDQVKVKIIAPL
jgi:hypothetical protein